MRPIGLKHVGFKDVGVPPSTLAALHGAIRASGATSYMEVVSTTPETCLNSARVAVELGVDCLLGGTDVAAMQEIVAGSKIQTFPFPGFPRGHPTKLAARPRMSKRIVAISPPGTAPAPTSLPIARPRRILWR